MLNYGKINFSVIIKIYDRATSLIDKQNWYEIKKNWTENVTLQGFLN
jgi:hypothetical protein